MSSSTPNTAPKFLPTGLFPSLIATFMLAPVFLFAQNTQLPAGRTAHSGNITNAASNLCVDVARPAGDDGINVQLGQCSNRTSVWDFIDLGGGEYALFNRQTRRVLDVAGGGYTDGTNVQQYTWNNSAAQRWRVESIANGAAFKIINQRSGKCLDISERGTAPGTNIHQWQCHGMENQQWRLNRAGGSGAFFDSPSPAILPGAGTATSVIGERPRGSSADRPSYGGKPYSVDERTLTEINGRLTGRILYSGMIVSRASAKCIDVDGAKREAGVNIQQWTCNGTNAQLWDFFDVGRGEMAIVARASNKVMDVDGASSRDGANIAQHIWNKGNQQRWRLEPASRGFFKLVSVNSNKCVDVDESNGGKQDGANVHQWQCHGHENQQWRIEIIGSGASWANYNSQPGYTQPNTNYADQPPAYLVGTWEGYNPVYQAKIRLAIYSDGAAMATIDDNLRVNGYFRSNRLYLGTERYEIQQERRGFRTSQIGQPNNVVSYTKVR